jgi:hypothetical protein
MESELYESEYLTTRQQKTPRAEIGIAFLLIVLTGILLNLAL